MFAKSQPSFFWTYLISWKAKVTNLDSVYQYILVLLQSNRFFTGKSVCCLLSLNYNSFQMLIVHKRKEERYLLIKYTLHKQALHVSYIYV